MIEITGVSADETLGEVVVETYQTGVIFDLPLLGGYRYDTQRALYAPGGCQIREPTARLLRLTQRVKV